MPIVPMVKYGMVSSSLNSEVTSPQDSTVSNLSGTQDSDQIHITDHKLNEINSHHWSQSVMMFVCGKGIDDYLSRAAARPKADDPKFRIWKSVNSMVMSWLINSMTN